MPDENMPDGSSPLDALNATLSALDSPGGEAPAPVAATGSDALSAPAAPEAKAPETGSTGTPATPPVAAIAPTPPAEAAKSTLTPFEQQLLEQNNKLVQGVQEQTSQTRAMMEKMLKDTKPELTPEQRQEKINDLFKRLNTDPEAVIREITDERVNAAVEKLTATMRDPGAEKAKATNQQLAQLLAAPDGTIVRPELQEPEFFKEMVSVENQQAVMNKFYRGQSPDALVNNPAYYRDLYYAAKEARSVRASSAPAAPSQAAADSQRAVIAGLASTPGPGAGRTPAPEAKADPDKVLKEDMVKLSGGLGAAMSGAAWTGRR